MKTFDPEIAWYLTEAPAHLGESSSHGSSVAAIEHGGGRGTIHSSDPYHARLIDRLQHVGRARRCDQTWQRLDSYTQLVLLGRYHARTQWPLGAEAFLGGELVGVALATAEVDSTWNRPKLLDACTSAANAKSKALILAARERALRDLAQAHELWSLIWRSIPLAPTDAQRRLTRFEEALGL